MVEVNCELYERELNCPPCILGPFLYFLLLIVRSAGAWPIHYLGHLFPRCAVQSRVPQNADGKGIRCGVRASDTGICTSLLVREPEENTSYILGPSRG